MAMRRVQIGGDFVQGVPVREPRADRSALTATRGSFREQLKLAHAGQLNERIDKALAHIEELGARLAQSMTMADLKQYRQAIALLMRDITNHMIQVKAQLDWDAQAWEHRTTVILRKVDVELENLTNMIMNQEKDRLAILEKIGEIKGLLLDMRM
jgi:uncharacterized protein YaaR (DUF327 family)